MTSAKAAVEAATFDALAATIRGAAVYQDVPDDAPFPIVVVGDLSSRRLPGKAASRDRIVTVSVVTLVAAEERAPLLALMEQADAALDGRTVQAGGWTLAFAFDDDDAALQEDGQTYAGVAAYTVMALADD
jgi:hypothetical protein